MERILLTVVLAESLLLVASANIHADYTIHVVDPPITNQSIVADKPLPEVCRPGHTLTVRACRGEYEPASFVVVADRPMKAVRIEVGPLQGLQGTLDADAVDVRIARH